MGIERTQIGSRGALETLRISRWWAVSAIVHVGGGAGIMMARSAEESPPEPTPDEVVFLPPPEDAPQLETPLQDDRRKAAQRRRTEVETAPRPRPANVRSARGLSGRVGPRSTPPTPSAQGAAPVKAVRARQHKPARLPPATKRQPVKDPQKPKPQRAPEIDYGKAREAARHTLDQFVGRITPDEAIPEEQVFASLAERTARAPSLGDMPRVGRRGKLRKRAPATQPPGEEGLGASGNPDVAQLDRTLRMDADLMRRHPYWRAVYYKVQALWRFPRWAEEMKLQGEVHIAFRFRPETGMVSQFEVLRRSRIDGFDKNVQDAVRSAAPFGRVPADAPSATRIVWPFKFRNPLF